MLPVALSAELCDDTLVHGRTAASLVHCSDDDEHGEMSDEDLVDMNEAVPRDATESLPLPSHMPITDKTHISRIRAEVCRLWGQSRLLQTCPGPNPVCVEKSHLNYIRSRELEYTVAEKTDGVRYLLCCFQDPYENGTPKPCAYMIDRAFDAYPVDLKNVPPEIYTGTLLDGELLRNRRGVVQYLVYDCVSMFGLYVGAVEDYVARLDLVTPIVPLASVPKGSPPPLQKHTTMGHGVGMIMEGSNMGTVVAFSKPVFAGKYAARVMEMAGLCDFEYTDDIKDKPGQYEHDSDGLILTPRNMKIVTGTHWFELKWKYQHPLDLLLEASIGDNVKEWNDYADPVGSAQRNANQTLRSIMSRMECTGERTSTTDQTWSMCAFSTDTSTSGHRTTTSSDKRSQTGTLNNAIGSVSVAKSNRRTRSGKATMEVKPLSFTFQTTTQCEATSCGSDSETSSEDSCDEEHEKKVPFASDDPLLDGRSRARRLRQEKKARVVQSALKRRADAELIRTHARRRYQDMTRAGRKTLANLHVQKQNGYLDQPGRIQWRLRMLYRQGRSFKDAASGFLYSGYSIRFTLENSPMLESVLANFEELVREQYLHVHNTRLEQQSNPSNAQVLQKDVLTLRAASVVVECECKLDLPAQIMRCSVVRVRQDKMDPNSYLTITRTLNVMQNPVSGEDLYQALLAADSANIVV